MIKYTLIQKKNPITKENAFHASALAVTPVSINEIAEGIAGLCTLTMPDIKAVIAALEEVTFKHLRNGCSVRLGDLGSFHARLSSRGAVSEEEFTNENIRGLKVRFSPSSRLRYQLSLQNPHVKLVKAVAVSEEEE